MLLGHKLKIYTVHKSLIDLITIFKFSQIKRSIEEFGPDLEYINGPQNVIDDAINRLDTEMSNATKNSNVMPELFENCNDKSPNIDCPLGKAVIAKHQQKHTTHATNQISSGVFHQTLGQS
jgi:hypothetical protein